MTTLHLLTIVASALGTVAMEITDIPQKGRERYVDAAVLIAKLLNGSDSRIRPNINGPAVAVYCDIFIQEFGPVDEVNMDFGMEIYFRQQWRDDRLNFTNSTLEHVVIPASHISQIWLPDLYFPNEKSGSVHAVMSRNEIVKVFPRGRVRYSARITLKLACSMQLVHFPLDYQDCYIKISTYSYDANDMQLHWWNSNPFEKNEHEFSMPQFEWLRTTISDKNESYRTGQFSTLKATFHLKRQIGFYILQSYVPSILIVVLSWVSFWVNKDAVPARITLSVTTVLTMTTQLSSSRSNSMRVSYPKAIDVWYSCCMLCVFGALIEFAVVNVMSRMEKKIQRRADCEKDITVLQAVITDNHGDQDAIEEIELPPMSRRNDYHRKLGRHLERLSRKLRRSGVMRTRRVTAQGLDKCSRIIFPAGFILFNIVYWVIYTQPIVFGLQR